MKINVFVLLTSLGFCSWFLSSCGPDPYAPPPVAAQVDSVRVEVKEFAGRPDVVAHVRGRLSTAAAELVDAIQSRRGYHLYIEVREQTPRDRVSAQVLVPFQQKIPVETTGLTPGVYILDVNGVQARVEIPDPDESGNRGELL
ncbi:MAG: hypothetical protein HKN23_02585 [Verrucomicrobiales bacterium]|nr:hypothetical protein [Verrucomicrobiales bacterium]